RQEYAEAARETILPLLVRHLRAARLEPDNVADRIAANRAVLEETAPPEDAMSATQADQLAGEPQQLIAILGLPVEPRELVVLAVGVVVATLAVTALIAREQHRHALRQEQGGEEIAHLAAAQRKDRGIVRRPFGATVPAAVVILAVAVVVEVRLVVLLVVTD